MERQVVTKTLLSEETTAFAQNHSIVEGEPAIVLTKQPEAFSEKGFISLSVKMKRPRKDAVTSTLIWTPNQRHIIQCYRAIQLLSHCTVVEDDTLCACYHAMSIDDDATKECYTKKLEETILPKVEEIREKIIEADIPDEIVDHLLTQVNAAGVKPSKKELRTELEDGNINKTPQVAKVLATAAN